ncbi:hypothetical protein Tco_0425949 [Tanacetum coccineum]
MPGGRKELQLCEAKTIEPSVHEPPEVELKELPPHHEYSIFWRGDNRKVARIIAKELDVEINPLCRLGEPSTFVYQKESGGNNVVMNEENELINSLLPGCGHGCLKERRRRVLWTTSHRGLWEFFPKQALPFRTTCNYQSQIAVIAKLLIPPPSEEIGIISCPNAVLRRFNQDFHKNIQRPNDPSPLRRILHHLSDELIRAIPNIENRLTELPILIAPNWTFHMSLMCECKRFRHRVQFWAYVMRNISSYPPDASKNLD